MIYIMHLLDFDRRSFWALSRRRNLTNKFDSRFVTRHWRARQYANFLNFGTVDASKRGGNTSARIGLGPRNKYDQPEKETPPAREDGQRAYGKNLPPALGG
ncbi:hypothetical protein [Martelella sp. AMO21009]